MPNRNTRRVAVAKPRKPRRPRLQSRPAAPPVKELTLDRAKTILAIQHQQVEACRAAFFNLAQARAADMVVYQRKTWDNATAYITAEMQGLDEQIAALNPQDKPQGEQP